MTNDTLITKYRPRRFVDIIGQAAVVASLKETLAKKLSRAFLLTGPAGTGKTTLARIIAKKVGCDDRNITEIDAATHTGVDDMREITSAIQHSAMGTNPNRMYIIDECHMLSKGAWNSLLKSVEEPPRGVHWSLCTTEPLKVPDTIRSRCAQYMLESVDAEEINVLLLRIIAAEKFTTSKEVSYFIAEHCNGSPRAAISALAQLSTCTERKNAGAVMRAVVEEGEVIELCRALNAGIDWVQACNIVKKLDGYSAESIRHVVYSYFTKAAIDAKTEERAQPALAVLSAFGTPYPQVTGLGPVLLSLGTLLF